MDREDASRNGHPGPLCLPPEEFQARIMSMLEGAALALLADHIKQREAAARAVALNEIASEMKRLAALRSEVEAAQRAHKEKMDEIQRIEARAKKRAKLAARIIKRNSTAFEEIRGQIAGIMRSVRNPALASDLEGVIRMIEEVAGLDPDDSL